MMPTRLTLEFPGQDGDKVITFVCDSGDYDPGPELDYAIVQVERLLKWNGSGNPHARLDLEDV